MLNAVLKVQLKEWSPGQAPKIILIIILFVLWIFQVICIWFNFMSGKINQEVESTRNVDWTSEQQHKYDVSYKYDAFSTASTHYGLSCFWHD